MHDTLSPEIALADRIQGCWLGKSIGGTLGLPAEGRMERLHFDFYDPVPSIAPPNDDLELQLVWLHMIEQSTGHLTQEDFADSWLQHLHYMWDEYGRCRWNLRRGVPLKAIGTFENHFLSGMGSPIRSEIWASLFPDDSDSAAYYAALDASLDHGPEGIAGEVFFAVMQNAVASGQDVHSAIALAMNYIPKDSETTHAIELVLASHAAGIEEWTCWQQLVAQYGNENFTHAPLNVALTVWALFYGEEDFENSILLAVNGGYDTDCTAATVGATLGFLLGQKRVPAKWITPIGEDIYIGSGILGIDAASTLSELTRRTVALIGKLEPKKWDPTLFYFLPEPVDLSSLPGTIFITPLGSQTPVPWANGELPMEVKQAGGGTWTWRKGTDEIRQIICLAREGARLFINDTLLIECPPGLPYIPATHRNPSGSGCAVAIGTGTHTIRLELNSSNDQEASVLLTYPNLHIAPWTQEELPHPASLPIP